MDVRQANTDDAGGIERVARASLAASYTGFLDEDTIETALSSWYGDEQLEARLSSSDETFIVVSVDDSIVAFSQCALVGTDPTVGEIRWLHVHPDHRGEGIAADLLDRTQQVLREQGADVTVGLVLEDNEAGRTFYDENGFEHTGSRPVEVGEESFTEYTYEFGERRDIPAHRTETATLEDGSTVTIVYEEGSNGRLAPFFPAYRDEERETLYGWFCGNCESFDTAMDSMERLECNNCGNSRKSTRWDAAYL